jgi:1-acyl-sn-glycerol-3-phosphate acyltransferase
MSHSKPGFSLKKQFSRSKQIVGMTTTMAGGLRAAQRIGAFKNPPREKLPRFAARWSALLV